jgi:polyisoprenoid-binding protein YceI
MRMFKLLGLATLAVSAVITSATTRAAFAADEPDSVVVLAKHTEAKPDDPVKVVFERFKVTKATFDAKKIEGGKATLEIDTTSLKSGSEKRDAHLKTDAFIDATKFSTIVVDIDKVKKKTDKTYTAEATVKFRGVTKKYPITFDVVDAKDDTIKIKSETPFTRADFKVGNEETKKNVQDGLVIQVALTLKKT